MVVSQVESHSMKQQVQIRIQPLKGVIGGSNIGLIKGDTRDPSIQIMNTYMGLLGSSGKVMGYEHAWFCDVFDHLRVVLQERLF